MINSNKICIECKWCTMDRPKYNMYDDDPLCFNPDCNETNLVYGGAKKTHCFNQRYKEDGKCGKEGKYWGAR